MKKETIEDSLESALERVDQANRYYLLDSLHCVVHNSWASLTGNTSENDIEWMADLLSRNERDSKPLDRRDPDARKHYIKLAELCMKAIPRLQERMAHRLLLLRDWLNDFDKMQKAQGKVKRPTL